MINLTNHIPYNTGSFIPDITGYTLNDNRLIIDFTQSYDLSNKETVNVNVLRENYPWIQFTLSGSELPVNTGQYELKIFTIDPLLPPISVTWVEVTSSFGNTNLTWGDYSLPTKQQQIYTGRGYITGNTSSFSKYISNNENGFYYTFEN
jgi:hypothetical protein